MLKVGGVRSMTCEMSDMGMEICGAESVGECQHVCGRTQ